MLFYLLLFIGISPSWIFQSVNFLARMLTESQFTDLENMTPRGRLSDIQPRENAFVEYILYRCLKLVQRWRLTREPLPHLHTRMNPRRRVGLCTLLRKDSLVQNPSIGV